MNDPSSSSWIAGLTLTDAIADGVCVVAPDGLVIYANDAMLRLLDTERDRLIGTNGLDMVHPDDVARAFDGLEYAQQFPGRTAVAPFRILKGDEWVDVEVKTGILSHEGVDYLTMVVRDATPRRAVNRALESVAAARPLAETVELVSEAVLRRWPNTAMAVVLPVGDSGQEVYAIGLENVLVDHAAGLRPRSDGLRPWEVALSADPVLVVDVKGGEGDDEVLRAAALAQGFAGYGLAPIGEPDIGGGCLIVWFDHTIIARLEFFHAAPELTEVLTIALDRHTLHREMWAAARHDALTGVLNRYGFHERFEDQVVASRASDCDVSAVFYIDLDGLKAVNDAAGHATGDIALQTFSERVSVVVDDLESRGVVAQPVMGRLGGDEFAVAFTVKAVDPSSLVVAAADALIGALSASIQAGPTALHASIGLALDDASEEPMALLERSDAAMYRAKLAGRSRWSW